MRVFAIRLALFSLCLPAGAQTQQAAPNPNFPKKEFLGDSLALLSFCNFHDITDRYEIFAAFKELGITAAENVEIMAIRDKNYQIYRNKYTTPAAQEKICRQARSQFFFIKTVRKGVPIIPGSDTEKQPEKIETFGTILGVLVYCEMKVDGTRWGHFMSDMGVKAESMDALGNQARETQRALVAQYGAFQRAPAEVCAKAKNAATFINQ
jgi:hypothetical protein